MFRSERMIVPLTATALWLLTPGVGLASDDTTLSAVTVTAAPIQQAAPAQPQVTLDTNDFERVNVVNTEDLLKYAPNLFIRKRFIGDDNAILTVGPGSVGNQSADSLLFADGLLLSNLLGNSYSYPPTWFVVPPDDVASAQVLYGPFSAELPGNSIDGAVLLTTHRVTSLQTNVDASAFWQNFNAYGTHQTYAGSRTYASFGDRVGRTSFELSVNHLENASQPLSFATLNPSGGGGQTVTGAYVDPAQRGPVFGSAGPTDVHSSVANLRLGYDFGGGWTAQIIGDYWRETSQQTTPETYLRDAAGQPVYGGTVNFDGIDYSAGGLTLSQSQHADTQLGAILSGPLAGFDTRLVLSGYQIGDARTRTSNDYFSGVSDGAGKLTDAPAAGWRTASFRAERVFGAHDISFGLWSDRYYTEQTQYALSAWRDGAPGAVQNAVRGKTSTQAFWLQDQWIFAPGWSLTPGVRLENWRAYDGATGNGSGEQDYAGRQAQAVSPKLALSWAFVRHWSTTLSYGHAVRFPTVGELFQGSLDSQGNFNPASFDPNLQPERDDAFNLALQWRVRRQQVTLNLFLARLRNTIFQQTGVSPVNGALTTAYLNISRQRNSGVVLDYAGQDLLLPGLDVSANLSYTDARIEEDTVLPAADGNRLPRVPYWRGAASLGYRFLPDWQASLGYRYSDAPTNSLTGGQNYNSFGYDTRYSVLDTRLNWTPIKSLKLSVGVDNLTDDRYWVYHPYPGRTYLVEVSWKPHW